MPNRNTILMKMILLSSTIFVYYSCVDDLTSKTVTLKKEGTVNTPGDVVKTYGSLKGAINHALSGANLDDVDVSIVGSSSHSDQTDGVGEYFVEDIETGTVTVTASKATYVTSTQNIEIQEGILSNLNISLLPSAFAAGKFSIVLSWGETPLDLDSHLFVPTNAGGAGTFTEVLYNARGDTDGTLDSVPFAGLDRDDTNGVGPETVTILDTATGPHYARTYRYFVFNYNEDDNLGISEATVQVFRDGVLLKSYKVPTTAGVNEHYWHVFDIESDGSITDFNAISTARPVEP